MTTPARSARRFREGNFPRDSLLQLRLLWKEVRQIAAAETPAISQYHLKKKKKKKKDGDWSHFSFRFQRELKPEASRLSRSVKQDARQTGWEHRRPAPGVGVGFPFANRRDDPMVLLVCLCVNLQWGLVQCNTLL